MNTTQRMEWDYREEREQALVDALGQLGRNTLSELVAKTILHALGIRRIEFHANDCELNTIERCRCVIDRLCAFPVFPSEHILVNTLLNSQGLSREEKLSACRLTRQTEY